MLMAGDNGDRLIRVTPWWNLDKVYKTIDDMPDRHTSGIHNG